ncbi:MAG: hypothetical protein QOF33_2719, partial [Thermomicrobiales bacterium]|nr:hypothetical protein [Thermomicrobiales bacterium]
MTNRTRMLTGEAAPVGRAGQAGLLAALLMLATQLLWRLGWS